MAHITLITIEPTSDKDYIKSVMFSPGMADSMKLDEFPDNWMELAAVGLDNASGFFIKVLVDGISAGWFWFIPVAGGLEAHASLLANCRGRKAIVAAKKAIKWVFKHTDAKSIICDVFSDKPAVKWFCNTIGFRDLNKSTYPLTRNGKALDVYHLEIQRTT